MVNITKPFVDWNVELDKNHSCYKTMYGQASIDNVANCLSIMPQELDTPVLQEIRDVVAEYGGRPAYFGEEFERIGDPIKLKHLIAGKETNYGFNKPDYELGSVKSRIRWGMNDFPYILIGDCNQKMERKGYPQLTETGRIINREGSQMCHVVPEIMLKMRELGRKLEDEDWDMDEISSKIKEISQKNWIEQNAWDLSPEELNQINIDKRMGIKK